MAYTLLWAVLLSGIATSHGYTQIGKTLTAIPPDIPAETISVNLTANNIQNITDSDFNSTIFIEKLNLVNNLLDTISDNGLTPLTKLKILYISNNSLTLMPPLQPISVTIERLKLDKNQISSLKANYFSNFSNLILLHLNDNCIHTLQENAFIGLNNLVEFLLNKNHITCVKRTLFHEMNALQYFDISHNLLTGFLSESCPFVANEIALTPAQFPKLHTLILTYNSLTEVPDLRGAHMLDSIYFRHNKLTGVNLDHLEGLSNLFKIDFSKNNIKHIPNFSSIFDLNNNRLSWIQIDFNGISVINKEIF